MTRSSRTLINWFLKELFTTLLDKTKEGEISLCVQFAAIRNLEINGKEYAVSGVACTAQGTYAKKKQWVNWRGDAIYDWHASEINIPDKGVIGDVISDDLSALDDYTGEIPDPTTVGSPIVVIYDTSTWDNTTPVVDLTQL